MQADEIIDMLTESGEEERNIEINMREQYLMEI
jgi:hypothetical protein